MSLNLLPSEAKFQAQRMKIKGLVSNFLWIIGGIWLLLLIVAFGGGFFLNLRINQLNKNYQAKLNDYKSRINEVALTQKIKYQAKVVAKVLDTRFEYGEAMNLVNNLFPEEIRVDDIQIKGDKSFEINGGVTEGNLLDEVESEVAKINAGEEDGFASAKITSISVNASKGWLFTIELFLK